MIHNLIYRQAQSVEEAFALLNEHGEDAKFLAGGHSLVPAMKLRLTDNKMLVDIAKIQALKSIEEQESNIVIGSMVTHDAIANSSLIQKKISFFSEAADLIGDVQVRNMGTIGGSIAHADPSADWPALLLASEATVHVYGNNGIREISAEDFFLGLYTTALEENEIITSVHVPVQAGTKSAYMKFMQPASRFAIVGCAAMMTGDTSTAGKIRVAFAGVSSKPFRDQKVENILEGKPLSESSVEDAGFNAAEDVSVMSDHYASEAYRKQMAKVYCKRVLNRLGGF